MFSFVVQYVVAVWPAVQFRLFHSVLYDFLQSMHLEDVHRSISVKLCLSETDNLPFIIHFVSN
jgi:hypothetical protein